MMDSFQPKISQVMPWPESVPLSVLVLAVSLLYANASTKFYSVVAFE